MSDNTDLPKNPKDKTIATFFVYFYLVHPQGNIQRLR